MSLIDGGSSLFKRQDSAALFVGVQKFPSDKSLTEVRYGVDDAIDLAYAFSMEERVPLVQPEKVVLALSGKPRKSESASHLDLLINAGATVINADQNEILDALKQQAAAVGKGGLFIVSFATHGFTRAGTSYLLTANSVFLEQQTAISTTTVLDIATQSRGGRSLVLLDACRDRPLEGRAPGIDELSAAPPLERLIRAMTRMEGQVVFYGAAAGKVAYDDDRRKNGVFTSAVLDGLRCNAGKNALGMVTVHSLHEYVEGYVVTWIRKNRDPHARSAIQVNIDGPSGDMPLAACDSPPRTTPDAPVTSSPVTVTASGSSIDAVSADGKVLWQHTVDGHVAHAEVADLDGNGSSEVIVGVDGSGTDRGKVVAFNAGGDLRWSHDTNTPTTSDRQRSAGSMAIHTFAVGDLYRKKSARDLPLNSVVALTVDANGGAASRLCIIDGNGHEVSTIRNPGQMQDLVIYRPNGHFAPKIVVSALNTNVGSKYGVRGTLSTVFMLDPKKVSGEMPPYRGKHGNGSQLWDRVLLPAEQQIARLDVIDYDGDGRLDVAVWVTNGQVLYLDPKGGTIASQGKHGEYGAAQLSPVAQR
jgi:hypothetical protein